MRKRVQDGNPKGWESDQNWCIGHLAINDQKVNSMSFCNERDSIDNTVQGHWQQNQ